MGRARERTALKAIPLKRIVDEVGGIIAINGDDAAMNAVKGLELRLGRGKIARDTGENFEFGSVVCCRWKWPGWPRSWRWLPPGSS